MTETYGMTGTGTAIEFQNVSLAGANGKMRLHDVSFEIREGETVAFIGRSGSGKTSTLRVINRLAEPTDGYVIVSGRKARDWDPIRLRRHVGYVIQEIGLFPHFTVGENVALVPRLENWDETRVRARVEEMLNLVGLPPAQYLARYPAELSGGQRQRVGVARALAADPPIVLMDEPFGALDPITRSGMQRDFAALARKLNKTIVFVTHDVSEAFLIGSRIGLFKEGSLIAFLPPDEFARSADPEARAFLDAMPAPLAALSAHKEG